MAQSRLCVELNHLNEVILSVVGTLQPAGMVTPGAVEEVADGVVVGVDDGFTELVIVLVLDGGFVDEEVGVDVLAVELGVVAGEDETQPRS